MWRHLDAIVWHPHDAIVLFCLDAIECCHRNAIARRYDAIGWPNRYHNILIFSRWLWRAHDLSQIHRFLPQQRYPPVNSISIDLQVYRSVSSLQLCFESTAVFRVYSSNSSLQQCFETTVVVRVYSSVSSLRLCFETTVVVRVYSSVSSLQQCFESTVVFRDYSCVSILQQCFESVVADISSELETHRIFSVCNRQFCPFLLSCWKQYAFKRSGNLFLD